MRSRRRHSARTEVLRIPRIAAIVIAVLLGVVAQPASATTLSGFGDPVPRWQASFPRDFVGCDATNCYGPVVARSSARYEFTYVVTRADRVVGFDLALPAGTPLARAQLHVAELFPTDVEMGSLQIVHRDEFGNSCAVYDLHSKSIQRIFGQKAFGGSDGTIGIELAHVLPNGSTTYEPDNVNLALIAPTYLGYDASC